MKYPIQINGRRVTELDVVMPSSDDAVRISVLASEKIQELLDGRTVRDVLWIPNRIINIRTEE